MITSTTTTIVACDVCGKRREVVSWNAPGDVPPGWGWTSHRTPAGPVDVCSIECAREWAAINAAGLFIWQAIEEKAPTLAVA